MQNNHLKLNTLLLIVLVFLVGFGIWKLSTREEISPVNIPEDNTPSTSPAPVVSGPNKEDLVSFSIAPGATVSGKMTATGVVKGGYFFEANILVNVLDANKSLLRAWYGMATTEWMTADPVTFTTELDFTGLPKGPGFIQIKNDNPSDDRGYDKEILIPIVIL